MSPREKEILEYIIEGYTNKEIADVLCVAEQTIKNHVRFIFLKLNAKNRAHAVAISLRGKENK